jgi:hypothetical protein
MATAIIASVGYKGRNLADDVKKIHALLKQIPAALGGPPISFDPTRGYSVETDKHIYNFQLRHFGKGWADAKIEPGRETLVKLNALSPAAGGAAPATRGVLPPATVALPYSEAGVADIATGFGRAFVAGLSAKIDRSLSQSICDRILADPVNFYAGYVSGTLSGLLAGLKALLELIATLAKVSETFSIRNILNETVRELYLVLTSESHRKLRAMQVEQARAIAKTAAAVVAEIQANPSLYAVKSAAAGRIIGEELSGYVESSLKDAPADALGKFFGLFVGRAVFEIVFAILLAVATGGAGTAARLGTAAAEGGSLWARLAARLAGVLDGFPALRTLIIETMEREAAVAGRELVTRELFAIIRNSVARSNMSAAEKVSALERIFPPFMAENEGFLVKSAPSAGVQAFWVGDQRPWGLVVDTAGNVWQHTNFATAGDWLPGMVFKPNLALWTLIK